MYTGRMSDWLEVMISLYALGHLTYLIKIKDKLADLISTNPPSQLDESEREGAIDE